MSHLPRPGAHIVVADANVETRDYVVRLFGESWRVEAAVGALLDSAGSAS